MGKKILVGLGIFVLIVALVPLLLSKDFAVSRSTTINAPVATVYPMVADLGRWSEWDPWTPTDPDAVITVSESSTGPGATRTWKGEVIGAGSMTNKAAKENEQVDFTLAFTEPFPMESDVTFTFQASDGGTQVTWTNSGTLDGYIAGIFAMMMDGMVGPDFEKGLAKMKAKVEGA